MDGQELLFSSNRNGPYALYNKRLGSDDDRPALPSTEEYFPGGRLKNGSFVIMNRDGKSFFRLTAGVDKKPEVLLTNEHIKDEPRVSPDGHWVAYNSTESGRWEVYLAKFPEFTERRQVSNNGGCQGHWRKDGKELFYLALDGTVNSVEVEAGPPLKTSIPQTLFQTRILINPQIDQYAVTGDGQRFLLFEVSESGARTLNVVLNWPALSR